MVRVIQVDTDNRTQVWRFVRFVYDLYRDTPQWVPPPLMDAMLPLNRRKHPFYEHSDADFFLAERDGQVVGRLAVLENRRFNAYHGTRQASFYFFDVVDDLEVAEALFQRAFEWAEARGLDTLVGPKGFGPFDGYGVLIEGFEHRQMMTMMNYNFPYYPRLLEALGFEKEVDFVSTYLHVANFRLPERIHRIAERVQQRGTFQVHTFRSKRELRAWADKIGRAYNETFVENWEYYPLTEREIAFVTHQLLTIAVPQLIKIITHKDEVVGFLFGFPDVSAALQRARGHLCPWNLVDLLLELRRTKWIAFNGAGVLPRFHGHGGNVLLYAEMEKTVRQSGQFEHAELTQVAETAVQMRRDLENLGSKPYKTHRVFRKRFR